MDIKKQTEVCALMIEAESIKAEIEAMKAKNRSVDLNYNSAPFTYDHFNVYANDLMVIAIKIRNIAGCEDE